MKLEIRSFRTKVAQRIFILFIICAILPVSVFAVVSYFHVRNQLISNFKESLRQESKSLAVSFYEKLLFLRSEMKFMAAYYETYSDNLEEGEFNLFTDTIFDRFHALAVFSGENSKNIYGALSKKPAFSSEEWQHLLSGEALLYIQDSGDTTPDILMCVAFDTLSPQGKVLIGKISHPYLLEAAERKPPLTEVCVLDRSTRSLLGSMSGFSSLPERVFKDMFESTSGQFEWQHQEDEYMASYSSIFLKSNFYYPEWIVIISILKSDVLAPMTKFKLSFILTIAFTLALVFFISMNLIQKNMGPIEVLKNATRKISEGAFGHRVVIKSGDEFESLGQDFNEMSAKLKEGQDLLVNAAKMSTMGQMAAGIMHEIKQPLTAIYGHLDLAMLDTTDSILEKRLKTISNAISRLNTILDRFHAFSSRSNETMEKISLHHIVAQIHELMEHEFNMKSVQCDIEMEENPPSILGDQQGLVQVVSNLIVNSIDALEEKAVDQRRIIIKSWSSEEKVYLSVEDNGCGIPKDAQERIFDPFFTTKTPGKGTGLGMAIIESILHRHDAGINVESEEGKGTIITIAFPIYNKTEAL